jgi:hypothetical protein
MEAAQAVKTIRENAAYIELMEQAVDEGDEQAIAVLEALYAETLAARHALQAVGVFSI